jgi:hypothetical protein
MTPKKIGEYDLCLYNFPPESVKEVILGYRMPPDKRKEIVDLVKRKYPHTALFQAMLSETKFDLDIVPYTA